MSISPESPKAKDPGHPAVIVNPIPAGKGPVDGLPYKGNATGRTGPGTTCMVLRSSFTVAGTFTFSAFDFLPGV